MSKNTNASSTPSLADARLDATPSASSAPIATRMSAVPVGSTLVSLRGEAAGDLLLSHASAVTPSV